MPTVRHAVIASLIILAASSIGASDASRSDAQVLIPRNDHEEAQLRDFLIDTWSGKLDAIRSVEYHYEYALNGANGMFRRREGYYAQSGERFHAALIDHVNNGVTMAPEECAWDGRHAQVRAGVNTLRRTADRRDARLDTPIDSALLWWIRPAYGLQPRAGAEFEFAGARWVDVNEQQCIEVRYRTQVGGRLLTLIVRHARELGYSPVNVRLQDANGFAYTEIDDVRYHQAKGLDGVSILFPIAFEMRSASPGRAAVKQVFHADENTLRVNEKLDDALFKLEPWPNEDVFDGAKLVQHGNPNWPPDEHVPFPFRDFMERNRQNERMWDQLLHWNKELVVPAATVPTQPAR